MDSKTFDVVTDETNNKLPVPGEATFTKDSGEIPRILISFQLPTLLTLQPRFPTDRSTPRSCKDLAMQIRGWCPRHGISTAAHRVSSQRETATLLGTAVPPSMHLPAGKCPRHSFPPFFLPPPPHRSLSKVSGSPHGFQTHSIVKDSVEFLLLLPAAPKC